MFFGKRGENEIRKIEKTIGFSKIIPKRKTGVFSVAYACILPLGKNDNGYLRRQKTRKKCAEKPHQTAAPRGFPSLYGRNTG